MRRCGLSLPDRIPPHGPSCLNLEPSNWTRLSSQRSLSPRRRIPSAWSLQVADPQTGPTKPAKTSELSRLLRINVRPRAFASKPNSLRGLRRPPSLGPVLSVQLPGGVQPQRGAGTQRSATRSRQRIGARTCSSADGDSWTIGPRTSPVEAASHRLQPAVTAPQAQAKVRKPAHAMLNIASWRGGCSAPPSTPRGPALRRISWAGDSPRPRAILSLWPMLGPQDAVDRGCKRSAGP